MRKPSSKFCATPARSSRFRPHPECRTRAPEGRARSRGRSRARRRDGAASARGRSRATRPRRGTTTKESPPAATRTRRPPHVQSGAWPGYTSVVSELIQLRRTGAISVVRKTGPASTASDAKVYLETYGCQMNVADSDLMLRPARSRRLRAHGRSGRRRSDPDQHLRGAREGGGAGVRARQHARDTARRAPTWCSESPAAWPST